jgi:hypothetical protein
MSTITIENKSLASGSSTRRKRSADLSNAVS